jgi:hypothetical protein
MRFVIGLAVGSASEVVPLFIGEAAPHHAAWGIVARPNIKRRVIPSLSASIVMSGGDRSAREGDHVAVCYEAVRRRGVVGSSSGVLRRGYPDRAGCCGWMLWTVCRAMVTAFARRRRHERVALDRDEFGAW